MIPLKNKFVALRFSPSLPMRVERKCLLHLWACIKEHQGFVALR